MADNNDTQAPQHSSEPQSALKVLDVLVGEWEIELSHPLIPDTLHGRADFEWLLGGQFLLERSSVEHPDFPYGIFVIGYDEEAGHYKMHYFDSRGITRLYEMSMEGGVWKVWRDDPDFSQRFTGRFSDDGNTITGNWEISEDGTKWEHDFAATYKRVQAT
jgi:hypothetical protein